jgi:cysteine synthase A
MIYFLFIFLGLIHHHIYMEQAGVGHHLKACIPAVKIVLADPQGSGLFNKIKHGVMYASSEAEGTRRRHQVDTVVEGIGANRMTRNLTLGLGVVDDAVKVEDAEAVEMARWLLEKDGLFVGSSSAVHCVAAVKLAERMKKVWRKYLLIYILSVVDCLV